MEHVVPDLGRLFQTVEGFLWLPCLVTACMEGVWYFHQHFLAEYPIWCAVTPAAFSQPERRVQWMARGVTGEVVSAKSWQVVYISGHVFPTCTKVWT